ncbi:hypothetical protein JCM33374_g5810 [Metschnikowia sp. JCM 33374]|nr:hypothetical protein JCM33374_g5810 [Metschnikowia sp. JCM 33374]
MRVSGISVTLMFCSMLEAVTTNSKTGYSKTMNPHPKQLDMQTRHDNLKKAPYGGDAHTYKPGTVPPHIENQILEGFVVSFVEELRSFVNETSFDAARFERKHKELGRVIADIDISVQEMAPSENLSKQLRFAKNMYKEMLETHRIMRHYSTFDTQGNRIVYKVLELGIRALVLKNSQGTFDVTVSGLPSKIIRLYHTLDFRVNQLKMLTYLPYGTRKLLSTSVAQIRNSLAEIRSYVEISDE